MQSLSRASQEPLDTENRSGEGTEWRPEWRPESKLNSKENLKIRHSQKFEPVTSAAGLWREEAPRANGSAPPPKPSRFTICRQRERDGLIVLKTVHDEAHITSLLIGAGELNRNQADDKHAIEQALERYIASGKAAEFDL